MSSDCMSLDPSSGFFPKALQVIAKQSRIPLSATFELTPLCNFNCKMCFIHLHEHQLSSMGRLLSIDEWINIAKQARELGTLYLTLTGGEIFSRKDFQILYKELSKMGFLITLMTNASMINDSTIKWLADTPPYAVSITLYGSNNSVYESVCGIKNGFSYVDHAISLLQEENIPIFLKGLIIKENFSDIDNMYKYATSKKLKLTLSPVVIKSIRGAYTKPETSRLQINETGFLFDKNNRNNLSIPKASNIQGPFKHHKKYLDDCGHYESMFTVLWNGKMCLCSYLTMPSVSLLENSVSSSWKKLLAKLDAITKPQKCISCKYEEYCLRCPGVLLEECGDYNSPNSVYCSTAYSFYKFIHKGGENNEK